MEPPDSHKHVGLDAIRTQLRELGYLRGPLSRLEGWMVAGRGGPSGFLRINALASLRVGLLGGPLLGIPAAAAVALANRPHITSPRDLLALALYLSFVLGIALAGLEFLTDTALAWLGRRGLVLVGRVEKLAARVGLLFSVATSLYLAWLVRGGRASLAGAPGEPAGPGERGAVAWVLWLAAVIGALGVGHLIGRVVRIGSLATLVAAGGGAGVVGHLSGPQRGRRLVVFAGAAALTAAAGLLVFAPADFFHPSFGGRGAIAHEPVPGRLVMLAVDGLDAAWFDEMKRAGSCPRLARLEMEGARYDLAVDETRVPPNVWTTVATGRPAEQHGILGYQAERVPGMATPVQDNPAPSAPTLSLRLLLPPLRSEPAPVSSGMRRARAVWEIFSEAGVPAAAVNWWATWPAQPDDGMVVSERTFARFAARAHPDRDAAPDGLQKELASRFRSDMQDVDKALERLGLDGTGDLVVTSAVIDRYHADVARRLVDSGLAQAAFVYLPGLDITRSRASSSASPAQAGLALARVLRNLDDIAGAFADINGPEDLLLVLADPGRQADPARQGVLLAWGKRVKPGRHSRQILRVDVAPTLLALAGLPTARDLHGTPVIDFLRVGDVATRLVSPIDSYGVRPEPLPGPPEDPFNREVLDRLRSLGYIH